MFETAQYSCSVAENSSPVAIVRVVATDPDADLNGYVAYRLATKEEEISNKFAVDPQSGWVSTLMVLDREAQAEYRFEVVATDAGTPMVRSSVAVVVVTVIDENDEAPKFSAERYDGAVNEDALPGTVILHLSTSDRDQVRIMVQYGHHRLLLECRIVIRHSYAKASWNNNNNDTLMLIIITIHIILRDIIDSWK